MRVSVTGTVYPAPGGSPRVTLFTKNQCTLCDKVKAVLVEVREEAPHGLDQVCLRAPPLSPLPPPLTPSVLLLSLLHPAVPLLLSCVPPPRRARRGRAPGVSAGRRQVDITDPGNKKWWDK